MMGMVYQWSGRKSHSIDPQVVGEAIEGIAEREGRCTPQALVSEAASECSPLHPLFTWDTDVAAEKWRVHEARCVINAIVVRVEQGGREVEAPAFISVGHALDTKGIGKGYRPVSVIVQDPAMRSEALSDALKDLRAIQRRYAAIKELSPVWDLLDTLAA